MLPKKLRISLVFLLLLFFSSVRLTFAQEEKSWAIQTPEDFMSCIDGTFDNKEICGQAYGGLFTPTNLVYGTSCMLAGYPCSTDPERQVTFLKNSALGQTSNLIVALYENPPVNMETWLADTASNIGIIPKAHAQGIGFSALSPILPLWKAIRNVAYTLLILVLLIIGLMIMFRTKIDPRTVISVQSAIPRVIITLILITFSYPIAGLMIDFMYLILFLGISVVAPAAGFTADQIPALQADFATGSGIWRLVSDTLPWQFWVGEALGFLAILFSPLKFGKILGVFGLNIAGKAAPLIKGVVGAGSLFGVVGLLLIVAFLFALIRIFFILLNAYIQIIIAVIFAPILILGQAIPGQSSFSSWLKNLLANLVVFPTTAILIIIAGSVSRVTSLSWNPPMLGGFSNLGEGLIVLGFTLVIPQIVISIKNLFKAKPAIPVGPGAITGPLLGGLTQATQFIYYARPLWESAIKAGKPAPTQEGQKQQ